MCRELTERALVKLWQNAGDTVVGRVRLIKAIDRLMQDEAYNKGMLITANTLAFTQCQTMQIEESAKAWAGEI